jgi:hypothetical protein
VVVLMMITMITMMMMMTMMTMMMMMMMMMMMIMMMACCWLLPIRAYGSAHTPCPPHPVNVILDLIRWVVLHEKGKMS